MLRTTGIPGGYAPWAGAAAAGVALAARAIAGLLGLCERKRKCERKRERVRACVRVRRMCKAEGDAGGEWYGPWAFRFLSRDIAGGGGPGREWGASALSMTEQGRCRLKMDVSR